MPKGQFKRTMASQDELDARTLTRKKPKLKRFNLTPGQNRLISAQRLNDVINMVLDGRPTEEVIRWLCDKYGIKSNVARNEVIAANAEIMAMRQWHAGEVVSTHVERYERMYGDLIELGARSFAMQALKQKEKLIGLLKTDRTEIHVGAKGELSLGHNVNYDTEKVDQEKRARLNELLAKMGV